MKSNNVSVLKHTLKYGILLGSLIITLQTILYLKDYLVNVLFKEDISFIIIKLVFIIFGIILGIIFFKRKNGSYITLLQALKIGIGVSAIAGFLIIIWYILLFNVFDPDLVSKIEAHQLKKLVQDSVEFTQAQIDRKKEGIKQSISPLIISSFILFDHLFYGVVTSLVTGLIVQKKKEPILD